MIGEGIYTVKCTDGREKKIVLFRPIFDDDEGDCRKLTVQAKSLPYKKLGSRAGASQNISECPEGYKYFEYGYPTEGFAVAIKTDGLTPEEFDAAEGVK